MLCCSKTFMLLTIYSISWLDLISLISAISLPSTLLLSDSIWRAAILIMEQSASYRKVGDMDTLIIAFQLNEFTCSLNVSVKYYYYKKVVNLITLGRGEIRTFQRQQRGCLHLLSGHGSVKIFIIYREVFIKLLVATMLI